MARRIVHDHHHDGIDRRGFLECMAWVGTGIAWTVTGGVLSSRVFGQDSDQAKKGDFTFVQISDSHIGFSKEPNKDVVGTLQATVDRINALPERPELLIHTGDLTQLSKPRKFASSAEELEGAKVGRRKYDPGGNGVFERGGKQY